MKLNKNELRFLQKMLYKSKVSQLPRTSSGDFVSVVIPSQYIVPNENVVWQSFANKNGGKIPNFDSLIRDAIPYLDNDKVLSDFREGVFLRLAESEYQKKYHNLFFDFIPEFSNYYQKMDYAQHPHIFTRGKNLSFSGGFVFQMKPVQYKGVIIDKWVAILSFDENGVEIIVPSSEDEIARYLSVKRFRFISQEIDAETNGYLVGITEEVLSPIFSEMKNISGNFQSYVEKLLDVVQ
jgi:hypothetical protein